jgi:hypothetical protein
MIYLVNIKSLDKITNKWAKVTPDRAPYYEEGIKAPTKDWATEAAKGQSAFEAAMRDPKVLTLREKKIKEVGSEKWQRKATAVGPSRYREGVPAATDDYTKGFSPFHGVISSLVLPEKGARGDPKNYARVKAIGDALNKKRMGGA